MLLCVLLLLSCGCSSAQKQEQPAAEPLAQFTDDLGREVTVSSIDTVVSLYGSYAEAWVLAGGTLAGATSDAIEERGLELGEAKIAGTVKEPNFETVLSLDPDFVILSADIAGQTALDDALTEAKIPHAYFRVDHYTQYMAMMKIFCGLTGRSDLYEQNAQQVGDQIDNLLKDLPEEGPSVLLVRAYSTGAKCKGAEILAGSILQDLGCRNVVDEYPSLLEDLSIEAVIDADPDFIFVVTMGQNSEKAIQALSESLGSSPAWSGLTAVKNGRFITLPQQLFHYKPNARWGESYACLKEILYG